MSDGEAGASSAETAGADSATEDDSDGYSGIFGTFPYAYRHSESRLLRSYVVLGGLLAGLVALVFTFAFVTTVASTLGSGGGTFTFVRSFVVIVGALLVIPLVGPVVLVARRHRRTGSTLEYDRALATGGYLFAFSLYVTLVISAPPELRDDPSGALAPVVELLYDLPAVAGAAPPLLALGVGYLLHRHYR
jgi:hypothetical protein